ncbi:MAG: DUF362 domain-containing protein [Thermoleophilia bacterium]|nr:DUF362 domain-containing protein [Thermoleophilia bacterium]
MAIVSISRCPGYQERRVSEAVSDAVTLAGGMERIISSGDRVLLKANMLAPADPGDAVTTHPAVIKAVAELVMEAGGIPFVADSPGYIFAGGKCRAIRACGVKALGDELGIATMQFESLENPFVLTRVPGGRMLEEVYAARLALEADVIINLPKLKTHASTWYTGAIKNMFGAVATKTRKEAHRLGAHEGFSQSLVDVYAVFEPRVRLTVMDAVTGMEGEGPRHGRRKQLGLILASPDPVALDSAASRVIGFDPLQILTTRYAADRGFGAARADAIEVLGPPVEEVAVEFERPSGRRANLPSVMTKIADRLLVVRPRLDRNGCDCCRICVRSCPVDAISMNDYPVIDRDRCIECFCCNEMCPTGAMEIKKSWLVRRLD